MEFCGTEQYTDQANEYKAALDEIEATDGNKSSTGLKETKVPVTVQLGTWLTSSSDEMLASHHGGSTRHQHQHLIGGADKEFARGAVWAGVEARTWTPAHVEWEFVGSSGNGWQADVWLVRRHEERQKVEVLILTQHYCSRLRCILIEAQARGNQ
ncbi:hypothetical protein JG688_00013209 [Phytophthora aleatoria]|uniref:Uncharacterized protein n=1 Tax=Phytophthora aleatoria TaxID=2496075 RepID=A0A8J5I9L5_9STRA|nr:hypothetical protein JG688_00013209 [Phytophthora aleatoria]